MKRFLSIILALALVISMVPATFAAGEVKTELKYVFKEAALLNPDPSTADSFYAITSSDMLNSDVTDPWYSMGGNGTHRPGLYSSAAINAQYLQFSTSKDYQQLGKNAMPVHITIGADGVYVPSMKHTTQKTSQSNLNIFLVSVEDCTALGGYMACVNDALTNPDSKVMYLIKDADNYETGKTTQELTAETTESFEIKAGEYYILIAVDGYGTTTHDKGRYYAHIGEVKLTRQPYVKLSAEANEVSTGKTIKVTGKAFNADDTVAGAVTYSVSPATVASVAADGTVTALKVGTATITAKATIGGVEYSDSVEVKVNPIDKDYEYVFSRQAVGVTENTNPGWSAYKTYDSIVTSVSPNRYCYVGGVELAAGALRNGNSNYAVRLWNIKPETNALVLKLEIPYGGAYKPSFVFNPYQSGAQVTFYLLKSSDAESKNWNMSNVGNIRTAMADAKNEGSPVIEVGTSETYSVQHTKVNANVTAADEFKDVKLDSGDYYLIMSLTGVHDDVVNLAATDPEKIYNEIWPKSFKLTAQPYVTVSADVTEISVNDSVKVVGKAFNADDTDAGVAVTYSASPADVASVTADGTVTALKAGTATITAKATIGGIEYFDSVKITVKKIDKTHKFVFKNTVMSDASIAAAKEAGSYREKDHLFSTTRDKNTGAATGEEFVDEYSDFDTSKGTDKWAYSPLGGFIYLFEDYVQFYTYKVRFGNNSVNISSAGSPNINTRFVLQVEVKHPGKYDISAEMYNLPNGSEADVYIVKKSEVDGSPLLKEWGGYDRMTVDYLKTLPIDGRISNIGTKGTITTDYICTKELEKGDYYIILHTNSDSPSTNGTQLLNFKSITMTESEGNIASSGTPVAAKSQVSFATDVNGKISKQDIPRGETVELSAPEINSAGKVFKRWVKGTDENGICVSVKANDTYKVITNTYLTAIYGDAVEADGKVVEFYNENGEYFTTVAAVDGKAVLPTEKPFLPGYTFLGWYISEEDKLTEGTALTADVTRAVAKFVGKTVLTTTGYNIVQINGTQLKVYDFGTLVSGSDDKAKYWLRDGQIVKFGTTYDYYIWDAANIMSSYDATTAIRPTVVLDKYSVDGAYMIEYDKGNETIAEVGILFGSSAKITIDSCNSKATSQWNRAHGQFSATPVSGDAYARGYLIYGSEGNYKVIYTDAIAIQ